MIHLSLSLSLLFLFIPKNFNLPFFHDYFYCCAVWCHIQMNNKFSCSFHMSFIFVKNFTITSTSSSSYFFSYCDEQFKRNSTRDKKLKAYTEALQKEALVDEISIYLFAVCFIVRVMPYMCVRMSFFIFSKEYVKHYMPFSF